MDTITINNLKSMIVKATNNYSGVTDYKQMKENIMQKDDSVIFCAAFVIDKQCIDNSDEDIEDTLYDITETAFEYIKEDITKKFNSQWEFNSINDLQVQDIKDDEVTFVLSLKLNEITV